MITLFISVLLQASFAQSNSANYGIGPRTLAESVKAAIELNPKTRSKNLQLQSIHEVTKGTRADMYPQGAISCSAGTANSHSDSNWTDSSHVNSSSKSCGVSASVTIYDGGAGYNRYKASQKQEEAVREQFNSTNPYLQNTKGQLAAQAMASYMSIILQEELKASALSGRDILRKILTAANKTEDRGLVNAKISDMDQSFIRSEASRKQAVSSFVNVTTLEPSGTLEGLDESIAHVVIPGTADEAVEISLERNPEVKAMNASLEAAQYTLKAARASMGPYLAAVVSYDVFHNSQGGFAPYRGHGSNAYAGVRLVIPFVPAQIHYSRAQRYAVEAARAEREAALSDAKFGIENTYAQLDSALEQHQMNLESYADAVRMIQNTLAKINQQDPGLPTIQVCLSQFENLQGNYVSMIQSKIEILTLKFSIQQITGTVFDESLRAAQNR
ncbi:MAG: hypothetical protein COT73_00995 [Bdellovibrio sp. CG10_big_fil_rev_8_21_14_0_10_47_8]|nr:MAG: hypothetical protein COT73_00995 [Bdellovibrio sp. CG10_big_fil_rev_8_21_14_0_10_47_8]